MLAYHRVKLQEFKFFRSSAFVFVSRVEMPRTSGGFQFDLFACAFCHSNSPLDLLAAGTHFEQDGVDAVFVDGAQCSIGQAQRHPTILRFNPQAAALQIRQETTLGFIVRVGDVVAHHGLFPSYLTDACHDNFPNQFFKEARFYINARKDTTQISLPLPVERGLGMRLQTLAKSQYRGNFA